MCTRLGFLFVVLSFFASSLFAQSYLREVGSPTFTTPARVESGYVNLANGELHLEIPVASAPQRGALKFSARLVYDSRIWTTSNGAWQPTNIPNSWGGWRFVTSADPGAVTYTTTQTSCGAAYYAVYSSFIWTAPDGTRHIFPVTTQQDFGCGATNTPTGTSFAEDSTGYSMSVTNYTTAVVTDNRGTQVYPTVKDANGNYFSADSQGNVTDTLGRTVVTKTVDGNTVYLDVLNAQGQTSRYTLTLETIDVSTAFSQTGISEYSGTLTVVQSIALPDGTSYSFAYDSGTNPGTYGLLQSMTIPAGDTVSYAFSNFQDAYGNSARWLSSRTVAGGTWSYSPSVVSSCSQGQVGCQQKITLTKPTGDTTTYTFTLNNGAWDTETAFYNGSSTVLRTVAPTYDLSSACPCGVGASYVRPLTITISDAAGSGTITKQIQYTYDTPSMGTSQRLRSGATQAAIPLLPLPARRTLLTTQTQIMYPRTSSVCPRT